MKERLLQACADRGPSEWQRERSVMLIEDLPQGTPRSPRTHVDSLMWRLGPSTHHFTHHFCRAGLRNLQPSGCPGRQVSVQEQEKAHLRARAMLLTQCVCRYPKKQLRSSLRILLLITLRRMSAGLKMHEGRSAHHSSSQ